MTETDRMQCPDGGVCHHDCAESECFRVRSAGPVSGVFPNNEWPAHVVAEYGGPPAEEHVVTFYYDNNRLSTVLYGGVDEIAKRIIEARTEGRPFRLTAPDNVTIIDLAQVPVVRIKSEVGAELPEPGPGQREW